MILDHFTDVPPYRLSAIDKRAMKAADSITFHVSANDAYMSLNRDAKNATDGFDDHRLIGTTVSVVDYEPPAAGRHYEAFFMIHSPKFDLEWLTIRDRITSAPDPKLHLRWMRNNNSEALTAAGMVRDELRLKVTPARGKELWFLIGVQVGPDNSARMIRSV